MFVISFLVFSLVVADPDYLSYKFVMQKADEPYEVKRYYALRICDDVEKKIYLPYNSTHIESKTFSDNECRTPLSYKYVEVKYLDDIETIIENSYVCLEFCTKDFKTIVRYTVYPHQFCNTIRHSMENYSYVDSSNGYLYTEHEPIKDKDVIIPECTHVTPGMALMWKRTKVDVWSPSYQRAVLGGKGREEICDDADPLALLLFFALGMLLF